MAKYERINGLDKPSLLVFPLAALINWQKQK